MPYLFRFATPRSRYKALRNAAAIRAALPVRTRLASSLSVPPQTLK